MNILRDNYIGKMAEMFEQDSETAHIIWCCTDNSFVAMGMKIVPDNCGDPLEYMLEHGLVEPAGRDAFAVMCSQMQNSIVDGTEENSIILDVSVKFDSAQDYTPCGLYILFLRDENKRVTHAHINLRPYDAKQIFAKQVLQVFTSDKAPQLYAKRIEEMMKRYPDKQIAFIQFDVERFKLINETYGVEAGDKLLNFFNEAMGVICTADQPFCRLTADVFMVVTAFDSRVELLDFVHTIESRLSNYNGMEYRLIFGIAIAEDRTLHTRTHGDNASLARQRIKGNALENIGFYNDNMKAELHKRQSIEDDMHKALLDNEFVMFLQPKNCISTGRIIGAEALARWIHPIKGMISPAEFIPLFEKNGFIQKLDYFIWERACEKIRDWIDEGIEPVPISVNVSREYLRTVDVADKITGLVKKYDIPPEMIELEITESLDSDNINDVVKSLKDKGFKLLMDDFGSGYSSLNMLKTTQFDVLKIDRAFLSEFMESQRGRTIISHTISMSKDIGLDIIAEGVETYDQACFLSECGCDAAQGFYYSKPLCVKDFDEKLKSINV